LTLANNRRRIVSRGAEPVLRANDVNWAQIAS
jgi:hypothetical protein